MKTNLKRILKQNYQQLAFVFLAFLAMVLVSYFYVSNIVSKQIFQMGEETMNTAETYVSGALSESQLAFSNMSQTVQNMVTTGKNNEEVLRYLRTANITFTHDSNILPDFLKVYAYLRGDFLDGSEWVPPDDYDPQLRPWYIGAVESDGEIYFSEPYVDADTGDMCISYSQQLYNRNGEALGVLAMDLNLSRVTHYLKDQTLSNSGYGVFVSDSLVFVTHEDEELIGVNMADAGGEYQTIAEKLDAGQPVSAVRFTDADGTDSVAFFRTIFNGWHIGLITPRESYYAQVYQLAFVLGVLGFVLMVALSYILVRTRVEKMRADEESRRKSNFLANMSHEMRTPMNAIIGMTHIAQNTKDPEKISYCLNQIDGASNHLLGVINDVLDMSKIEAGKLELSETDFVLREMVQEIVEINGFKMREKNQQFNVHVGEDVPVALVADRQLLAQVITNLLSNANKFTDDGGKIDLTIDKIEEKEGRCRLRVEVADNGIGISEENQKKLFRSFQQADSSVSRKYGGSGLGLTISKNIIELMDGTAEIESELGQGAKFIFTVWAKRGQAVPAPAKKQATAGAEGQKQVFLGKHILLAEDVAINREIVYALLENTGAEIHSACNGEEACRMFAEQPERYDLILMDIHMPEVDGYEATRRIRAMDLPQAKTVPILAMTANVFKEDVERSLEVGMNGHLGKPLNAQEVFGKIGEWIQGG